MKWIAFGALAGWAGIVRLAWVLADRRIAVCHYDTEGACALRATAARDAVLTSGLIVALLVVVALAVGWFVLMPRLNRKARPSTGRALIDHERSDRG